MMFLLNTFTRHCYCVRYSPSGNFTAIFFGEGGQPHLSCYVHRDPFLAEHKRPVCDEKTPVLLREKADPTATEGWQSFLDGGMKGGSRVTTVVREGTERVKLLWADGHESEFCCKWLRDHDPAAFNSESKQREVIGSFLPIETHCFEMHASDRGISADATFAVAEIDCRSAAQHQPFRT